MPSLPVSMPWTMNPKMKRKVKRDGGASEFGFFYKLGIDIEPAVLRRRDGSGCAGDA